MRRGALTRFSALAGALRRGTAADGLPFKLTLILNGNCPTRCSFCSIWKTPSQNELGVDEWDRVFCSAPHTVWANLSGGEIFLRKDIGGILDALTARMRRLYLVDFPTTGYFPDRMLDACERLVRGGVRKVIVSISLDGPPALHDELRGRAGAHEAACAAMRAVRAARLPRVRAYFGTTVLNENYASIPETIAAAQARIPGLRERDFHFNIGMESGHYYRNEGTGARPPKAALAVLERYRRGGVDPVSVLERAYRKRIARFLDTGRSPVPCAALRASAFVNPQGEVFPCSIYSRPLGGLRDHGYELGRVLGLSEAQRARRAVIEDRCPGCWTPCEAYQSLLASFSRSGRRRQVSGKTSGIASDA